MAAKKSVKKVEPKPEVQLAVIADARYLNDDRSGSALAIGVFLQGGANVSYGLLGSEAWGTLTSWGGTDIRSLIGRPCWVQVDGQSSRFITMWSSNVRRLTDAEEIADLKFRKPDPLPEGEEESGGDS